MLDVFVGVRLGVPVMALVPVKLLVIEAVLEFDGVMEPVPVLE